MGDVIKFTKRNIQQATTKQLKRQWDLWFQSDEEDISKIEGVEFHYQEIHIELNRRGEGNHCAV